MPDEKISYNLKAINSARDRGRRARVQAPVEYRGSLPSKRLHPAPRQALESLLGGDSGQEAPEVSPRPQLNVHFNNLVRLGIILILQ